MSRIVFTIACIVLGTVALGILLSLLLRPGDGTWMLIGDVPVFIENQRPAK